jgi:hypothetical protein
VEAGGCASEELLINWSGTWEEALNSAQYLMIEEFAGWLEIVN